MRLPARERWSQETPCALRAEALRERIFDFASKNYGVARDSCRLEHDAIVYNGARVPLAELFAVTAARQAANWKQCARLTALRVASLSRCRDFASPSTEITGEIAILQSVHGADGGVIINPMQCRAQIEGAIAQGSGLVAVRKRWFSMTRGQMINPTFRNYRIPAFADVPQRTEIYFANTHDAFGPLGAKSMSEAPIYPIAPALANA